MKIANLKCLQFNVRGKYLLTYIYLYICMRTATLMKFCANTQDKYFKYHLKADAIVAKMKSVKCFVENVPKTTHRMPADKCKQTVGPKKTPSTQSIKQHQLTPVGGDWVEWAALKSK